VGSTLRTRLIALLKKYRASNPIEAAEAIYQLFGSQGSAGGRTAAQRMTQEQRTARARKAAKASAKIRRARITEREANPEE
jgi:hypothetical protein